MHLEKAIDVACLPWNLRRLVRFIFQTSDFRLPFLDGIVEQVVCLYLFVQDQEEENFTRLEVGMIIQLSFEKRE